MTMRVIKTKRLSGLMLCFTALFNIADYFLTIKALQLGFDEWNPFVLLWLNTGVLPVIKIIVIPLLLLVIWKLQSHFKSRLLLYSSVLFTVYFMLMCYFVYIFHVVV
ncbi:MAG: hypothetical protein GX783_06830 [Clostridiales bacterium]|nr:hypothetical protein [Clostridiales bacterium]